MSNEKLNPPNANTADAPLNEKENKAGPSPSEWNTWDNHNRDDTNNTVKRSHQNDIPAGANDAQLRQAIGNISRPIDSSMSDVAFAEAVAIRINHQRTESDLSLSDINECLKTLSMNPNNNRFGISADDFINRPMSQNATSTRDGEKGRESYPPSKSKVAVFESEFQSSGQLHNDNTRGYTGDNLDNNPTQFNENDRDANQPDSQASLMYNDDPDKRRSNDHPESSLIDSRNHNIYPPNTGYHRDEGVNMQGQIRHHPQMQKQLPYGGFVQTDRFQSFSPKSGGYTQQEDTSNYYGGGGNDGYMNNNYVYDPRNDPNRSPQGHYGHGSAHRVNSYQHQQQQQQQYRQGGGGAPYNEFAEEDYYGSNNNFYNDQSRGGGGGGGNNLAGVENLSPIVSGFDGFVYKVQFKRAHRNFLRSAGVDKPIRNGDFVIVEADRGEDLGVVCETQPMPNFFREGGSLFAKDTKVSAWGDRRTGVKHIIRHALPQEYSLLPVKLAEEQSIVEVCRDQCRVYLLPMLVVDAEYQFDRHKLTIFYESNSRRIDFRELVRDLFAIYKTRIWMEAVSYSFRPSDGATRAMTSGVQTSISVNNFQGGNNSLSSGNLNGLYAPNSPGQLSSIEMQQQQSFNQVESGGYVSSRSSNPVSPATVPGLGNDKSSVSSSHPGSPSGTNSAGDSSFNVNVNMNAMSHSSQRNTPLASPSSAGFRAQNQGSGNGSGFVDYSYQQSQYMQRSPQAHDRSNNQRGQGFSNVKSSPHGPPHLQSNFMQSPVPNDTYEYDGSYQPVQYPKY